MEKMKIEYLVPYLPYNLKGKYILSDVINLSEVHKDEIRDKELCEDSFKFFRLYCKPILRPMSDLIKDEFVMDSWRKSAILFLDETAKLPHNSRQDHIGSLMYSDLLKLFEWNFDVFGLIEKGLAINYNEVNK